MSKENLEKIRQRNRSPCPAISVLKPKSVDFNRIDEPSESAISFGPDQHALTDKTEHEAISLSFKEEPDDDYEEYGDSEQSFEQIVFNVTEIDSGSMGNEPSTSSGVVSYVTSNFDPQSIQTDVENCIKYTENELKPFINQELLNEGYQLKEVSDCYGMVILNQESHNQMLTHDLPVCSDQFLTTLPNPPNVKAEILQQQIIKTEKESE